MKKTHKELQVIEDCLNEFETICADSSFQNVLTQLKEHSFTTVQFDNYKIGSHTFARSDSFERDKLILKDVFTLLQKKKLSLENRNDLFILNQHLLHVTTHTRRQEKLIQPYHYPDPFLIDEGLDLLYSFLKDHSHQLLLSRIAFVQGLLSLHPFQDGNHRTCRLILDFWLSEMNLPTTTIIKGTDFLISNPVDEKVFSLEDAVQKVMHAIGETILTGSV